MTIQETGAVMDIFKAAYPSFYKDQTDRERLGAARLWAAMFADEDAETVVYAVKAFIATDEKGFPPVIGVIKNKIAEIKNPDGMTEYEAWNIVHDAIRNGIYGAEEEFEKLPDELKNLVGSPNWLREKARMESETVESVIASNFMRSYKARNRHRQEQMMLPADVKNFINSLSEKMNLNAVTETKQLTETEIDARRKEIRKTLENI